MVSLKYWSRFFERIIVFFKKSIFLIWKNGEAFYEDVILKQQGVFNKLIWIRPSI